VPTGGLILLGADVAPAAAGLAGPTPAPPRRITPCS
jgi:hypothetical protein